MENPWVGRKFDGTAGSIEVKLVDESRASGSFTMNAALFPNGNVRFWNYDISSTAGDYEWSTSLAAEDVPRAVEVLGGDPGTNIIDLLAEHWTGDKATTIEARLENAGITLKRSFWRS